MSYKIAEFLVSRILVPFPGIAGSYKTLYLFFHIWLVVVLLHKVQSLVLSKVTYNFHIVALVCNLQFDSVVVWNMYMVFVAHYFVPDSIVLEARIILFCLKGIPNAQPMLIQKLSF